MFATQWYMNIKLNIINAIILLNNNNNNNNSTNPPQTEEELVEKKMAKGDVRVMQSLVINSPEG